VSWGGASVARGGEQALDEIGRLAELGVDRVVIPPPAYDVAGLRDGLAAFGETVVARAAGG
jgi:hypothetical protein